MEDINSLPIEVLSHILDYLEVDDWREAAQVCRLWHSTLQSARFQRQIMMRINSTFVEPPTELEKRALAQCRNLQLTQWDESYDYDYYDSDDEDEENEDENSEENSRKINVVEFKYLYQPSPEYNIGALLFAQQRKLECLELCSTFDGCRYILEDRLQELHNLTELTLDIVEGRKSNPISLDQSFWILRHDRIRKLKLLNLRRVENFKVVTPSLVSLDVRPLTIHSMPIINPYSGQLQRINLQLENPELINDLLSLKFPNLTCLRIRVEDEREHQDRYARLRHRQADAILDEQFLKGVPKLKRLWCESHLLFFRVGAAIAKFGHLQLEEVKLDSINLDAVQLDALQALPRLKTFKMHSCDVLPVAESPRTLPRLCLPHLKKLSLANNQSHIVFNRGLVGLTTLKMTMWSAKNHKIIHKICDNLPNLQSLTIILSTKLVNTAFRSLYRLTKLRTFRVDNVELTERLWHYCPEMASVRRLVLTNGSLTMGTVAAIARLFPALTDLRIEECFFQNCDIEKNEGDESDADSDCDDDDGKKDELIQLQHEARVRQYFPKCRVSLYSTMFSKMR